MVDGEVACDCKVSAEEAADTVEGKATSADASEKFAVEAKTCANSLIISVDIRPLTLLSNVHRKVDSLA